MTRLEKAIELALRWHAGQKDKAGAPYILHCLRVMLRLDTEEERIVGILHDTIEDAPEAAPGAAVTPAEERIEIIRTEFGDEILADVLSVTLLPGEDYLGAYIPRARSRPRSKRAKLADIEDNLDRRRIPHPTEKDFRRWDKYLKAKGLLLGLIGS